MPPGSNLPGPVAVGIIPARIGSDEVHAKVLVELGGKPVIQHVYERAVASGVLDEVLIAADDDQIVDVASGFGAQTFQSRKSHICGTDRCAEAAQAMFANADMVVNIQADEPFLHPDMVAAVLQPLRDEPQWDMTTLCCECSAAEANDSIFQVKVAKSCRTSRALYFSRAAIPYPRNTDHARYLQHIGIYAFRMQGLLRFAAAGPSDLEMTEGLEQLRALEAEMRIKVIETNLDYPRICIDTQEDIDRARAVIAKRYQNQRGES